MSAANKRGLTAEVGRSAPVSFSLPILSQQVVCCGLSKSEAKPIMPLTTPALAVPPELEHLQTQFMAAVEQCAILLLDPKGRIISWNRGAEIINGWRADEVIG